MYVAYLQRQFKSPKFLLFKNSTFSLALQELNKISNLNCADSTLLQTGRPSSSGTYSAQEGSCTGGTRVGCCTDGFSFFAPFFSELRVKFSNLYKLCKYSVCKYTCAELHKMHNFYSLHKHRILSSL